jgi:hypothetical protein
VQAACWSRAVRAPAWAGTPPRGSPLPDSPLPDSQLPASGKQSCLLVVGLNSRSGQEDPPFFVCVNLLSETQNLHKSENVITHTDCTSTILRGIRHLSREQFQIVLADKTAVEAEE